MKGVFSILLAAIFTLQSIQINLNDISKLVDLIEHANYHAEAYGDNWTTFFSKHYGELKEDHEKTHEHEKKEHSKLPNVDQIFGSTSNYLISQKLIQFITPEFRTVKNTFFYQSLYHFLDLTDIFQPPRS